MKNEKYTNHFNLAAPVSRLTKLSFCIASICFAYSYQSDIPMVKPSLDYLQNLERTKVYEDSLDIIEGNGTVYKDCSASIKRTEDRTISCGEDYTGSITQRRHIYGTGVIANGECRNTSDGKATNWSETSNTCVYAPVCSNEDSTVTKEECPRGYHGAITHTKTKRSIHFGKRVAPDVCSSEYQTTTQDSNTCEKDVNITDGGNKVTIPDGKGGKKIIDFSDEPIKESTVCNEAYELNGESGQWVTFKRGGPSFWLPMYEDYINKYGVKKLYAEVFNAEKNKTIKWMAKTATEGGTKCIGLENKFVNSEFADSETNYINHKIESPTGLKWDFIIYKDVYHNYDVKNTVFQISDEEALKNHKRVTLNARRFNAAYDANRIDYNGDNSEKKYTYVFESFKGSGWESGVHYGSDLIHLKADEVNIVSPNAIDLWELTFRGDITSNIFNAPNINLLLDCGNNTIPHSALKETGVFNERIRSINIKKATLKNWTECTEYASHKSLDSYVNINDLTLSGEMKLFEKTHFNGNVHNATYLLSYGTINGDIDMVLEVGKTNGNYYISFGEHTGRVRGNDESLLDLIPNEFCNNISFGGVSGKWYNFKGGGNAFQLPLYENYIANKGKMALFDKAMNAFQRVRYSKALITQSDTAVDTNIFYQSKNINVLLTQDTDKCAIFADEYRNNTNNNLVINDNTANKTNFAILLIPNSENALNNLSGENFIIRAMDVNLDNKALGRTNKDLNMTFNDVSVKFSNMNYLKEYKTDRHKSSFEFRIPLFENIDYPNINLKFNNLKADIPNGYDIALNSSWTNKFKFNKIDGNLVFVGNKGWAGWFIGNEANLARVIFEKYPKDNGGNHKLFVNTMKVRDDIIIPYDSIFNGDLTVVNGDIINYGTINGSYCIQSPDHYLNNFNTVNATNRCGGGDGYELIPNDFCNASVVINGDNSGWYSFKRGSPAFYKPFVTDYINKHGAADFYNWLYNSEYTKTYYLRFGNRNENQYENKCLLMGNDFWSPSLQPTKDNKLNLAINWYNLGDNRVEWFWNALDKNGQVGGAFNAYLNLDLNRVNWYSDTSKNISYKDHKLYADTIKLRNAATLGRVLHSVEVDKILSDSIDMTLNSLTLISGKVNYIDGLETINLNLEPNEDAESTIYIKDANVRVLTSGNYGYGRAPYKAENFYIDDLKYKSRINIDKNSIINGNITNVYKNSDYSYIYDYIYGTLNGNLKTNNDFYLYGVLNGDLWMRGGSSRKIDNFGTHNGQIHNYDDIGYKYK